MSTFEAFSKQEQQQYRRHFSLADFGVEKQLLLKNARVLIVGVGALGCPAATYLAAAGVGVIGLVDNDTVELSNLHRQVLYTANDLGFKKVNVAKNRLEAMNPNISVITHEVLLNQQNVFQLIENYDFVIDASDNFPTRYLLNDACVLKRKTLIHGSVLGFSGTVTVLNALEKEDSYSPNYRDLFPEPPLPEDAPSCAEAGVIGVIPGIIGGMQASECIKLITKIGKPLTGRFATFNALLNSYQILSFDKDPANPLNAANENFIFDTDYPTFCHQNELNMKSITVEELKSLLDTQANFQLIDVREPHEADICTLNGVLIPMGEVPANVDKFDRDRQVIVHCRSGKRSATIINFLESEHGFTNLYNLEGGILAYAAEIDPEMESY